MFITDLKDTSSNQTNVNELSDLIFFENFEEYFIVLVLIAFSLEEKFDTDYEKQRNNVCREFNDFQEWLVQEPMLVHENFESTAMLILEIYEFAINNFDGNNCQLTFPLLNRELSIIIKTFDHWCIQF